MSQKRKRPNYTKEFKQDAIKLVIEQGYSCPEVGRRLEIPTSNVSRWVRLHRKDQEDISESGAHALCLVCPFCSVMYDGNQKSIESQYNMSFDLPVLYLTQILGLAMGFDRKELGLNMNVVKTKALLAQYFEDEK